MELIALMNNCRRYSEDGWESAPTIKDINPETTVQELIDWQKEIFKQRKRFISIEEGWEYEYPKNFTQIHILQKSE